MPTPLPGNYPGSNAILMSRVWPYLPPHDHFVSVFGGIGGEICAKPRYEEETLNELNADNINFFRVLRDHTDKLIDRLKWVLYSEVMFNEEVGLLQSGQGDSLRRAVAWAVVANQSRGYKDPTAPGKHTWLLSIKTNSNTRRWANLDKRLRKVADRFRNVQLRNQDWRQCIEETDDIGTLLSVAPPFIRPASHKMYKHSMTELEHETMLRRLRAVKGMAVVMTYPHPMYDGILHRWRAIKIWLTNRMSRRKTHTTKPYIVYMNW